jgi:hypothetical protein
MKKILIYTFCWTTLLSCSSDDSPALMPPLDSLPDFDMATFSNPTTITNQYYGPKEGQILVYEGGEVGFEPEEEIRIERLMSTYQVMGISAVVQRDVVRLNGIVIEDTDDWLAQDDAGNLWYMGDVAKNYQEDGRVIDTEGSWEAGVDGALPGYWLPANPQAGDEYMQEYLKGEAEDYASVEGFETVTIDLGTYDNCLVTKDINPFEPDEYELKYYAPGLGLIKEDKFEDDELVEVVVLVEIIE